MAKITGLKIGWTIDADCAAAMVESLDALRSVRVPPQRLADLLGCFGKATFEAGDFPSLKLADLTADGAGKAILAPGEVYQKLVAAIADHFDLAVVVRHGWPILSVECGSATVTEAGGGGNASAAEVSV